MSFQLLPLPPERSSSHALPYPSAKIHWSVNLANKQVLLFCLNPHRIVDLVSGEVVSLKGSCDILCTIASPKSFIDSLESIGLNVIERFIFQDHYNLTKNDWQKLKFKNPLLITSKEAVKLVKFVSKPGQVFVLEQKGTICETSILTSLLKEVVNKEVVNGEKRTRIGD